jgi:hypothetical protein
MFAKKLSLSEEETDFSDGGEWNRVGVESLS